MACAPMRQTAPSVVVNRSTLQYRAHRSQCLRCSLAACTLCSRTPESNRLRYPGSRIALVELVISALLLCRASSVRTSSPWLGNLQPEPQADFLKIGSRAE